MAASNKKTVYLHIGSPKTGTSALQYFLLQNCKVLAKKKFHYPLHEVDPNGISSGNARPLIEAAKKDVKQARNLILDILNTTLPNVILSSEYFYFFKDGKIETLKELLAPADTKVIVYLRRQDSMLMSVYHQQIKRHGRTTQMDTWFYENYTQKRYTYKQVNNWAQFFGKGNMIVRPYEKQQFVGGTIFSDFLNLLSLQSTTEYVLPKKRINPAYRIDALEAMRLFNTLPLSHCLQSLDAILQDYSEFHGHKGDWPYILMSPRQRIQMYHYHAQCNTEIARDYLGRKDGRFFYDPLPNVDEPWKPYPGLSPQAVQEIAAYIDEHDKAVCRDITDAIAQGIQSDDKAVQLAARTLLPGMKIFSPNAATFKGRALSRLRGGVDMTRRIYHVLPVNMRKPITAIVKSAYRKARVLTRSEKS
jgi:hypothetical protein